MAKVKIVYGSVGGNTRLICEEVQAVLTDKGHDVEIFDTLKTEPPDVGEYDALILACPTYGIGELEKHFERFLWKLRETDLKGHRCAVIGLGDPKYDRDYHLESAKILMDFLKEKEAEMLYMPLRISKNPLPLIEQGFVERWAEKISEKL